MFFSPNNSLHITFHRPKGNSHGQQQRPFPSLNPNTNDFLKFPLIWWVLDQPLCWLHWALPINKMEPCFMWFSAIWIFLLRMALPPPNFYCIFSLLPICRSSFYIRNQKSLATTHFCHSITYHRTSSDSKPLPSTLALQNQKCLACLS